MNVPAKIILALFALSGLTLAVDAQCQAQTTEALKKMLLAAGGTLNPQLVAINAEGAKQFKSHFKNTASGVIAKEDRDRDAEEEVDDDEEGAEYQDGRNDDQDDNDDGRVHSRKRRSTTIGQCYSPGIPVNNRYLLCHTCDAATVLTPDYFPQYINEVVCNPNKAPVCFQGQGECTGNAMPTIFLKKSGNCVPNGNGILLEEWLPVVINVNTCCECRLLPGSFLIPLTT